MRRGALLTSGSPFAAISLPHACVVLCKSCKAGIRSVLFCRAASFVVNAATLSAAGGGGNTAPPLLPARRDTITVASITISRMPLIPAAMLPNTMKIWSVAGGAKGDGTGGSPEASGAAGNSGLADGGESGLTRNWYAAPLSDELAPALTCTRLPIMKLPASEMAAEKPRLSLASPSGATCCIAVPASTSTSIA